MSLARLVPFLACISMFGAVGCAADDPSEAESSEGAIGGTPSGALEAAQREREAAAARLARPLYDLYKASTVNALTKALPDKACAGGAKGTAFALRLSGRAGWDYVEKGNTTGLPYAVFADVFVVETPGSEPYTKDLSFVFPRLDSTLYIENLRLGLANQCAESRPYKPVLVCRNVNGNDGPTLEQCGLAESPR